MQKVNSTTEGSNSDKSTVFASITVTGVAAPASQVTSISSHSSHHQPLLLGCQKFPTQESTPAQRSLENTGECAEVFEN